MEIVIAVVAAIIVLALVALLLKRRADAKAAERERLSREAGQHRQEAELHEERLQKLRPEAEQAREAAAEHETPYGRAAVRWTRADGTLTVHVVVPPGTRAVVELPGADGDPAEVGSGRHRFEVAVEDPARDAVAVGSIA